MQALAWTCCSFVSLEDYGQEECAFSGRWCTTYVISHNATNRLWDKTPPHRRSRCHWRLLVAFDRCTRRPFAHGHLHAPPEPPCADVGLLFLFLGPSFLVGHVLPDQTLKRSARATIEGDK